jgi:hypothetical protein
MVFCSKYYYQYFTRKCFYPFLCLVFIFILIRWNKNSKKPPETSFGPSYAKPPIVHNLEKLAEGITDASDDIEVILKSLTKETKGLV